MFSATLARSPACVGPSSDAAWSRRLTSSVVPSSMGTGVSATAAGFGAIGDTPVTPSPATASAAP
eukprot:983367-Lingulodinium_polyedra.AAC.1